MIDVLWSIPHCFCYLSKYHRNQSSGDTDEDAEYAASRYVPPIKTIMEDLASNSLSLEDYPSVMPMPDMAPSTAATSSRSSRSGRSKGKEGSARGGAAASVRKKGGASSKWAKSSSDDRGDDLGETKFTGGRCIVFMLGGLSFGELRHGREVARNMGREIVMGGTTLINPKDFIDDLSVLGQDDD